MAYQAGTPTVRFVDAYCGQEKESSSLILNAKHCASNTLQSGNRTLQIARLQQKPTEKQSNRRS